MYTTIIMALVSMLASLGLGLPHPVEIQRCPASQSPSCAVMASSATMTTATQSLLSSESAAGASDSGTVASTPTPEAVVTADATSVTVASTQPPTPISPTDSYTFTQSESDITVNHEPVYMTITADAVSVTTPDRTTVMVSIGDTLVDSHATDDGSGVFNLTFPWDAGDGCHNWRLHVIVNNWSQVANYNGTFCT